MNKNDKEIQKELKNKFEKMLRNEVWQDESMVQFCLKECARIVPLSNNKYISIDKPRIETSFCFGYSDSKYDTEDFDRANAMAAYARKSEEYFIKENLKQIENKIKLLDDDKYCCVLRNHYYGQPDDTEYKSLNFIRWYEEKKATDIELTEADKETIKEAYKIELEVFKKRLNTYLKRYGTSKIKSWSYWRDE